MLGKGSGFHIPVYRLIREYKSYRDCRAGENLEWEEENVLWLNRRYAPAKAVGAALLMLLLTGVSFSAEYKNENIEIASYGDLMAARSIEYLKSLVRELAKWSNETEWVEFKCNNKQPQMIGEYISALSNSAALCERPKSKASRIIANTVENGLIKVMDPDTAPRYKKYIPYWA